MGTYFRIILYARGGQPVQQAFRTAFDRIAHLDRIFSDYKPDSELNRLCRRAGDGPVRVSRELYEVLERAVEVSRATDGAFDVTVKPVVRLWRRARRQHRFPDPDRLQRARRLVDYRAIRLDPDEGTVELLRPGMKLDLGGIAKGYTLDDVLRLLTRLGFSRALVDGGGDIAVGEGPPDKQAWTVLVPMPEGVVGEVTMLPLVRRAVATSGDAEQFVVLDGRRYSHIVDPRTGWPVLGPRQVTVVHRDATLADAFATALSVMNPEAALRFAEQRRLAVRIVYGVDGGGFRVLDSKAFEELVTYSAPAFAR